MLILLLAYGVVLLSKYPCKRLEIHPFPSTMYRSLLLGVFEINGEEVCANILSILISEFLFLYF